MCLKNKGVFVLSNIQLSSVMSIRSVVFVVFVIALFGCAVPAEGQPAATGDIIISEIMHSPDGSDTDREYVEVFNTTSRAIDLKDWVLVGEDPALSDPESDDVDDAVVVEPGEFAVLCENGTTSENGGIDCAYDYANRINHTSTEDYVVLRRPDGTQIDLVHYDEDAGWPDASDASLEYVGTPDGDNAISGNWEVAAERAGDFASTPGGNNGSPGVDAPDGSLPVELTQFRAVAEGATARLAWTTASESGNAGFAVQHRSDAAGDWSRLGFVDGSGTTTVSQSYRFTTAALAPGRHAFRLKQVDVDGTVQYSFPTRVEVRSGFGLTLEGPNPLSSGEHVRVRLRAPHAPSVRLVLYNVLGQRVRTIASAGDGSGGRVRARLSANNLSSGTYVLRVHGASQAATRRLTVVR